MIDMNNEHRYPVLWEQDISVGLIMDEVTALIDGI